MRLFLFFISIFFSSFSGVCQDTYTIGNTEYYNNQYYSTTGKPMVKRNYSNVRTFLQQRGYSSVPYGYEVDHIIPLFMGGTDDPSNMQLLTVEQHRAKTTRERSNTYSPFLSPSYYTPTKLYTPNFDYSLPTYNLPNVDLSPSFSYPSLSSPSRVIQTGPRGGRYYINSNGNKTYVK